MLLYGDLLLLGPAVVDIPSVCGVSTVVILHFVVGVPTLWLASCVLLFMLSLGPSAFKSLYMKTKKFIFISFQKFTVSFSCKTRKKPYFTLQSKTIFTSI
jgi:hypothetical protein